MEYSNESERSNVGGKPDLEGERADLMITPFYPPKELSVVLQQRRNNMPPCIPMEMSSSGRDRERKKETQ